MTVRGAAAEPGRAADALDVRVEVIGAGAVRRGAAAVTGLELGGRRARVALTALALAGGPVPADRLAALIWPERAAADLARRAARSHQVAAHGACRRPADGQRLIVDHALRLLPGARRRG